MKVQVYTHPGWFSCRTLEEFLASNRVRYEHHDVATDEAARAYLQSRGITALPVTIIDDDEVIIGFYPKKLIPALRLEVQVDLSGKTSWLAAKYDMMLGATLRVIQQLSNEQLQQRLSWRERWALRDLMMHVLSFPELAWLSHQHGSMSTDDMRASNVRLRDVQTSEAMAAYGEGVRQHIIAFLQSNDTAAFDRVVPAHYGGEVTVLELLTIILSHSTHHLKQAYWFITHELGVSLVNPVTDEDLEGIATPAALFWEDQAYQGQCWRWDSCKLTRASQALPSLPKRRKYMGPRLTMVSWKDEQLWLGKLLEYPESLTQGEILEELAENLQDAYWPMVL